MTKKSTEKTKARELQEFSGGSVSYATCVRLLRDKGIDGARAQIEAWKAQGDEELRDVAAKGDG